MGKEFLKIAIHQMDFQIPVAGATAELPPIKSVTFPFKVGVMDGRREKLML